MQNQLLIATEENTTLTTDIISLNHKISDLELTILAMER